MVQPLEAPFTSVRKFAKKSRDKIYLVWQDSLDWVF